MDIKQIDKELEPIQPTAINPSRKYGVMGLSLGYALHARLKTHCIKRNLKMAQLIKVLIVAYLNEKEK